MSIIAIDTGGDRLKMALVNNNLMTGLTMHRSDRFCSFREIEPQLTNNVFTLLGKFPGIKPKGVAIGLPQSHNDESYRPSVANTNSGHASKNYISVWAEKHFSLPVRIENTELLECLGEWKHGAAIGCRNMVMCSFGKTCTTTVVKDGNLLVGINFDAGAKGAHLVVEDVRAIGIEALILQSRRHDPEASKLLRRLVSVWAAAVKNLIHAYDPEIVVLAGDILQGGDDLADRIKEQLRFPGRSSGELPEVRLARYPDVSALFGAYELFSGSAPESKNTNHFATASRNISRTRR